ncbi:16S rRNA (adenine(1518)-N(6)/adenine(1519)-N(6))-dimethyltransferase RsmA [Thermanaerovibrio acidaminovorans]|uniref:16S rRNA (adenine(1518)-N(6)/adenine(1519)-N(6))- dimethyltransferase RsmA n=1 Tax=Thermanaerovibrio acidaminovorans TaxID=81462 RepID=UPI0024912CD1|nr:16S rRNA (adenine(1518)-N(6)/adenine(1519)-N(6))-dimethyltransferase RsmA [Thermanaerovibrio acidaminovorans]
MPSERFVHNTDIGQNFLINRGIAERIVDAAQISPQDIVLEIGPGKGVLTRQILATPCKALVAVELDRRLEEFLSPIAQQDPRLSLIWGDALRLDLSRDIPFHPTKVVANLPYHITTPIVWKLLEELAPLGLVRMVLMVQREAAMRMLQGAKGKDRSPLSVTLEAMGWVSKAISVPPGAFRPIPKVNSSVIRIDIDKNRELPTDPRWRRMLKASFSQRRKNLLNNWQAAGIPREEGERRIEALGLMANARAEELTLDQWLTLARGYEW